MTVLQSAGFFVTVVFSLLVAVLPAATLLVVAVLDAAAFEVVGHTPTIVSTGASSGTSAAGGAVAGAAPVGA
jgi:hypothetical protein